MHAGAAAITLAVAGHLAPLIVRANGAVEEASARGTVLGAIADPAFETCEVELARGETVLCHTGGGLDATIVRTQADEQRVAELLLEARHAGAQTLVDRLERAVRQGERSRRDDLAIIALRRTAE